MSDFVSCPSVTGLGTFIDRRQVESIKVYCATKDDGEIKKGFRAAYIVTKSGDTIRIEEKKHLVYSFVNKITGVEWYKVGDA